jgi:drug/metabolite transporter (DMT)-like permease
MGLGETLSLLSALAWAVAVILFKKSADSLSPFALNYFKNSLVFVLLWPTIFAVVGWGAPAIPSNEWLLAMLSGFIGIGVADTLYFQALNRAGAAKTGMAATLYTPSVILLSSLFLGESLHLWQWLGVLLVLVGVVLVTYQSTAQSSDEKTVPQTDWLPLGMAGFSVFLMAIGIVMAKPLLEKYSFLWVVQLRVIGGLLGMTVWLLFRQSPQRLWREYQQVKAWPTVLAGAFIGTYMSMVLWLAGYKYAKASIAAVLNEMSAVFIVLLASFWLKERLSLQQWLGAACCMAGIGMVVWFIV